jgi:2-polyprenyl-3-methyl-5-hydroxy-6-metoxy-1,4-benzoquinol methylase
MIDESHCPLCHATQVGEFSTDRRRSYLRCACCALVFVPPGYHLGRASERREYDLHRNDVNDPGYRCFLSRLADPLLERLPPGARGLDFGCGPGPALARMLEEAGCTVALYDSFYRPDADVLREGYDFICATEVVEHLHRPGDVLTRLWSLLCPGGWLGIMTKLVLDAEAFSRWHYKNDPTHVCFFSEATWRWWADEHGAELELYGADVILLQKT